jgi:hypothetical protein
MERFDDGIWIADGPDVVAVAGFSYPTRMLIIELAGGGLFVWSPVALDEILRGEIARLGRVRHVVAPNSLHDSFLAEWQEAYPDAAFHAAPGLAGKRPDIAFATTLDDTPDPDWAGEIEQVAVPGNALTTEIVFFHRRSGTAIVTDLVQHLPRERYSGWRALIARWDGMTGPEPAVPRKFRAAFLNRRKARSAIGRILDWPVRHVVMAHGEPVKDDGLDCLRNAFSWLTG